MAKTTKTKYKFERVGTIPRKGDRVVSIDPREENTVWGTPHTVIRVSKEEDTVYTRALKSDATKDGGGGKTVEYDLSGFKNGNWAGPAFNRVLKRDTK